MGFMEGLKNAVGRFVPTSPVSSDLAKPTVSSKYLNRNPGNILASVNAPLREARHDVRSAWSRAAASAVDLSHNSGFISGMVDQYVTDLIGKGLQLQLIPNYKYLGMSEDDAWEWAADVEDKFDSWGSRPLECDAEDRNSFWKMQTQQCRMHVLYGETVTSITYRKRFGSRYGTKFKVIPAYSLLDKNNGDDIIHGVRIDDFGAAKSYFFRNKSERERISIGEIEIAKRDRYGRSQVVHVLDGAAGLVRGITPLAPVVQVIRQFDRLQDVTLQAAVMQTIFAAVIKSDLPSIDILQALQVPGEDTRNNSVLDTYLEASEAWNKNINIDLGLGGRIPHLMPNENLEFKSNNHPNGEYVDFAKFLLHEVARCLGLTFESATTDYSDATYASLNIGEAKNYEMHEVRRQNLIAPMCDEIFYAWLEEAIEIGEVKFPGGVSNFLRNKFSAFTTEWAGPGKPEADDLKAAKAFEVLDSLGIASQTEMAKKRGRDIRTVYAERAREQALRKRLSLRDPVKQRTPDVEEQLLTLGNSNEQ